MSDQDLMWLFWWLGITCLAITAISTISFFVIHRRYYRLFRRSYSGEGAHEFFSILMLASSIGSVVFTVACLVIAWQRGPIATNFLAGLW